MELKIASSKSDLIKLLQNKFYSIPKYEMLMQIKKMGRVKFTPKIMRLALSVITGLARLA